MIIDLIKQIWEKKIVKVVFILMLILLIILVLLSIRSKEKFLDLKIFSTPLNSENNFSQITRDNIFSFNGISFFKTNVRSKATTNLFTGVKLPIPKSITWLGEKGVVLTFKSSFTYTIVESKLKEMGEPVDKQTKLYSWYLDFSNGELTKISDYPIDNNTAVFDKSSDKLYYVPDMVTFNAGQFNLPEYNPENTIKYPLRYVDIKTLKDNVLSSNLGLSDITSIDICVAESGETKPCLIGRDNTSNSRVGVYTINEKGDKSELFAVDGEIISTNKPNTLLVIKSNEDQQREEGTPISGRASLHNLDSNNDIALDFEAQSGLSGINFINENEFYVLDPALIDSNSNSDNDTFGTYRAGKISSKSIESTVVKDLDSNDNISAKGFQITNGQEINKINLIKSFDNTLFIFGPSKEHLSIDKVSEDDATSVIKSCVGNNNYYYLSSVKQFKIFIKDNSKMNKTISEYTKCISQDKSNAILGYNYVVSIIDPINGRIVSD